MQILYLYYKNQKMQKRVGDMFFAKKSNHDIV